MQEAAEEALALTVVVVVIIHKPGSTKCAYVTPMPAVFFRFYCPHFRDEENEAWKDEACYLFQGRDSGSRARACNPRLNCHLADNWLHFSRSFHALA